MKSVIEINDVSKYYNRHIGIKNIRINFIENKVNIILGSNGSGKSTLIKAILDLIKYEGKITKSYKQIGYVSENYILPSYMKVYEFLNNLALIREVEKDKIEKLIISYLEYFNIDEKKDLYISNLSKGMKQKINIIQSFIHNPDMLIFDEPTSGLDKISKEKFLKLIEEEKNNGKTVIISTHYEENYLEIADNIYQFSDNTLIKK